MVNRIHLLGCFSGPVILFIVVVQSLSRVRLFVTPWTAARQASLSITNSQSLLKLMSIELMMPSNYLILCRPPLLLPSIFSSIRVFSNESALCIRWQSIGVSASASVLPMNIQDWFPLGWTGLISLKIRSIPQTMIIFFIQNFKIIECCKVHSKIEGKIQTLPILPLAPTHT